MKWFWLLLVVGLAFAATAQESVRTSVVPVVGTAYGPGVLWKTDVEIVNDTGSEANVALELAAAPDSPAILLSLGPGETVRFPDLVGQAFGLDLILSPLRVTTDARRPLTVRATVYGIKSGAELSRPQPIAVYHGQAYYPLRALDGLNFTDDYRTNIGLVNFSDRDTDFLLVLQRLPGRDLALSRITVGPNSLVHTSIQSLFPMITSGHDFIVLVETLTPQTYVYASVIDNEQTGRFVQPRVATR